MQDEPEPQLIFGDRRTEQRYALELDLRFSFRRRGVQVEGEGVTVDLSRRGILFTSEWALPEGQSLELRIAWPYLLQGVCPLELVARGKVVRTDWRGTLFQVRDYAFQTRGPRSFSQPQPTGGNCSLVA